MLPAVDECGQPASTELGHAVGTIDIVVVGVVVGVVGTVSVGVVAGLGGRIQAVDSVGNGSSNVGVGLAEARGVDGVVTPEMDGRPDGGSVPVAVLLAALAETVGHLHDELVGAGGLATGLVEVAGLVAIALVVLAGTGLVGVDGVAEGLVGDVWVATGLVNAGPLRTGLVAAVRAEVEVKTSAGRKSVCGGRTACFTAAIAGGRPGSTGGSVGSGSGLRRGLGMAMTASPVPVE